MARTIACVALTPFCKQRLPAGAVEIPPKLAILAMATQAIFVFSNRAVSSIARKCRISQIRTRIIRLVGKERLEKLSLSPRIAIIKTIENPASFRTNLWFHAEIRLPNSSPIIDKTTTLIKKDIDTNDVRIIIISIVPKVYQI